MDSQKVDMFMMMNAKNFEGHHVGIIREKLMDADETKWAAAQTVPLKDPTTALIISVLIGGLGIDRFYIGDTGLGIAKLLTCGGLGIWTIVDWFLIMGAAREKNMNSMQQIFY